MGFLKALAAPVAALMLAAAPAGAITYNVNLVLDDFATEIAYAPDGSGTISYPPGVGMTVTGSITTDGTLGDIDGSNLIAWSLTLADWLGNSFDIRSTDADARFFGGLFATTSQLLGGGGGGAPRHF
jgi:hypothetical protein